MTTQFETIRREIDGRCFEIRVMPAKRGRKALLRLGKRLAPSLAALLDGAKVGAEQELSLMDVDISSALKQLGQDIEEGDMDFFCDLFAEFTEVELEAGSGKLVPLARHFDLAFARQYQTMMKWLWACLEVNFGGFFEGQGSSVGDVVAALKGKR